jgi:hypothetical protein
MKVAELRIGNYIQDGKSKEVLIICELTKTDIVTSVRNRDKYPLGDGWFSEPIPLDEDIIMKFGATYSNGLYYLHGLKFVIVGNVIAFRVGEESLTVECEFVHQFQNLIFALTGEELSL